MKKILLLLFFTVFISCKDNSTKKESKEIKKENFPSEIAKIFEKHGGINAWRKQKTLSFNLGEDAHTVDLHSRKTVVSNSKYSLGFDGKNIWVSDTTLYKKDPKFYYNLYFYFYAMPFVLADDGIIYEKTSPITFEGKEYSGYKISYKANVGTSPDDNYKIYYNPETYKMEWLAYTVTFKSKKPSEKYNLIRYNSWEKVNGFLLPKAITWYKKDDKGMPLEPARPATEFTLPLVSQAQLADSFFEKPKE